MKSFIIKIFKFNEKYVKLNIEKTKKVNLKKRQRFITSRGWNSPVYSSTSFPLLSFWSWDFPLTKAFQVLTDLIL